MVASGSELRELNCRSSGVPITKTCQLTYQSWITKRVETVRNVRSVEFSQEKRALSWLFWLSTSDRYKLVTTLATDNGPYPLKVYNRIERRDYNNYDKEITSSYDNSAANEEIGQFYDRLSIWKASPSEGLSMSFSPRYWHDFWHLIFEIFILLLTSPFALIKFLPFLMPYLVFAYFVLLAHMIIFLCPLIRKIRQLSFIRRLERSIIRHHMRYLLLIQLLSGMTIFSIYAFWTIPISSMMMNFGFGLSFYGLVGLLMPHSSS